jgi:hypothetical protein
MLVMKRKDGQTYLGATGMPATRATKLRIDVFDAFEQQEQLSGQEPSDLHLPKASMAAGKLSFDLKVDGSAAGLTSQIDPICPSDSAKAAADTGSLGEPAVDSGQQDAPHLVQQQAELLSPALHPIRTRAASAAASTQQPGRASICQAAQPTSMLESPCRTRSQDLKEAASLQLPSRPSAVPADTDTSPLEHVASDLSIREDRVGLAGGALPEQAALRPGCLRQWHKSKADGTPDQEQPASPILRTRSGRRALNFAGAAAQAQVSLDRAAHAAADQQVPSSPRTRSMRRR